jgi:hypothetical protein
MNSDVTSETRRKYIPVGSSPTSMSSVVSEATPEFIQIRLVGKQW